jgi:hypothetical protein
VQGMPCTCDLGCAEEPQQAAPLPASFHAGCWHPERGISVACHGIHCGQQAAFEPQQAAPLPASFHAGCWHPERGISVACHGIHCGQQAAFEPQQAAAVRRAHGGIWGARHAMHVRFGVRGRAAAGCPAPCVIPCRVLAPVAWNLRGLPWNSLRAAGCFESRSRLRLYVGRMEGFGVQGMPCTCDLGCAEEPQQAAPLPASFHAGCWHPERGISVACHGIHCGQQAAFEPQQAAFEPQQAAAVRRAHGGIWGARHAMHVRFGVRGRAAAGCPAPCVIPCRVLAPGAWNLRGLPWNSLRAAGCF